MVAWPAQQLFRLQCSGLFPRKRIATADARFAGNCGWSRETVACKAEATLCEGSRSQIMSVAVRDGILLVRAMTVS